MQRILKYIISENTTPVTILDFLKKEGFSRHILSSMKNTPNTIILNGERGFGRSVLKPQDHLIVTVPETESGENIIRTKMDLNIIYEDEDILVINKPADMPVHPSAGNYENTLANAVAYYYKKQGETFIFRCINRLDRDTTGLLVIAKHLLAGCILSDQMLNRQIHRQYRAIVCGKTEKEGIIDAPIGRAEDSTVLRRIDFEHGETARTRYRLLSYDEEKDLSYISLKLDTGRTHQIRVHMSYIGHPLPGDFLYNPDYRYISRQPLHSYGLEFIHPLTGEPLSFTAHLPADMAALVKEPELTSTEGLWDNDF